MEKISIVKRRNKSIHELEREETYALENQLDIQKKKNYAFEALGEDKDHIFSLNLTPEQCEAVRSNGDIKSLDGTSSNFSLDMHQCKNRQIVFKFNFKKENTPKLIKTKHVCQMLQISTSFLRKLVNEEKIKSYKLGRLRRFLLEDILEYLTKNEEFKNSKV